MGGGGHSTCVDEIKPVSVNTSHFEDSLFQPGKNRCMSNLLATSVKFIHVHKDNDKRSPFKNTRDDMVCNGYKSSQPLLYRINSHRYDCVFNL